MSKIDDSSYDKRIAEYLKEYVKMPAEEFDSIRQDNLTMEHYCG